MLYHLKHAAGDSYSIYGVRIDEDQNTKFLIWHRGAQSWQWWDADGFMPLWEGEE